MSESRENECEELGSAGKQQGFDWREAAFTFLGVIAGGVIGIAGSFLATKQQNNFTREQAANAQTAAVRLLMRDLLVSDDYLERLVSEKVWLRLDWSAVGVKIGDPIFQQVAERNTGDSAWTKVVAATIAANRLQREVRAHIPKGSTRGAKLNRDDMRLLDEINRKIELGIDILGSVGQESQ